MSCDDTLKSYKTQLKAQKCSQKKKSRRRERSQSPDEYDASNRITGRSTNFGRPEESRPVTQIAPKSYLGAALRSVAQPRKPRQPSAPPSDPGSSSPSSRSSDDESPSDSSSDETSESEQDRRRGKRRRDNRHGQNRRRRQRSSSSSSRTTIKPIPPKTYDGSANVQAYHRFIRESDAYLRDGKVRDERKVFLLSYYLTGKAYDFYIQRVAITEEQWNIPQFYEGLFNFCFPVDYRMQLRKTLTRCHQNEKSVAEYTHELQDLFNMIGNIPERDQVLKFWNSARPSIQKELWRNRLNPEVSSWVAVVAQAEIIEIAENVAERRDRKTGQTPQVSGVASGSGGTNSKSKQNSADGSVRAVSFGSHRQSHKHRRRSSRETRDGQSRGGTPGDKGRTSGGGNSVPLNNYRSNKSSASVASGSSSKKGRILSDKEKTEYRAAGRCFNCGKEGHMSRNCPDNATVKSHGHGPPGASAFNVEPVPEVESDESAEVLDSLPLGAICFGDQEQATSVMPWPIEEWKDHYPYWNELSVLPRVNIGDCYAMVVDCILTLDAPFPGDSRYDAPGLRPELRFYVYWDEDMDHYVIKDRLTNTRLIISKMLLKDANFDISRWYAEQRSIRLGLTEEITHQRYMGDAIAVVTKKLLTDGIASSYPGTKNELDPAERFWVHRADEDGYIVIDMDLELDTHLERGWLEEPTFDLVSWYRQHLDQHEYFEQQYYEAHREWILQAKPQILKNEWHNCRVSHELRGCPKDDEARAESLPRVMNDPRGRASAVTRISLS